MAFSPFLSAADFAGVDFEWLPVSSIKPWSNNNNFLSHQSFGLCNPCLESPAPAPASGGEIVRNRPSFPGGDFQKNNDDGGAESPGSSDQSSITIIEGMMMSRACPYTPEQKKQRIERYKTKRNNRNFNKKIKYACRKSLADSRPRIRGRFARYNDDVVKNYPPTQWSNGQEGEGEEEANGGDNWINYFIDAYSSNLIP